MKNPSMSFDLGFCLGIIEGLLMKKTLPKEVLDWLEVLAEKLRKTEPADWVPPQAESR